MKLAITARGPGPEFEIDESFGRAYWILVVDLATGKWQAIDNRQTRQVTENAGLLTSRKLVEAKVSLLLTGETGPKAFRALEAAGIEVFHGASGTVFEAVKIWQEGMLARAEAANTLGSPDCLTGKIQGFNGQNAASFRVTVRPQP